MEVAAEGADDHIVGIDLAVGRVAGNVWRTDEDALQQVKVHRRLPFPYIQHGVTHPAIAQRRQQCHIVDNLAATGIYNIGYTRKALEEMLVGHVPRGIRPRRGQRHLESDDVGFAFYDAQRHAADG